MLLQVAPARKPPAVDGSLPSSAESVKRVGNKLLLEEFAKAAQQAWQS